MCTHASVCGHGCRYLPDTPCPTGSLARPGFGGKRAGGAKGQGEERCLGAEPWHAAGKWAEGGSDRGQSEVSIARGLSVFSCSSVFHLLNQL